MYKHGKPLDEEQAVIANRPKEVVNQMLAGIEKTIKGLMGFNP